MAIKRNSDGTASVVKPSEGRSMGPTNPNPNARPYPRSGNTSGGTKPNAKPYKGTSKG